MYGGWFDDETFSKDGRGCFFLRHTDLMKGVTKMNTTMAAILKEGSE
jgi:hypothetical protein